MRRLAVCGLFAALPMCSGHVKTNGDNGVTACVERSDCEAGMVCVDGKCVTGCLLDAGCLPAESCVDYQCVVVNHQCVTSADCTTPAACEQREAARCEGGRCHYAVTTCEQAAPVTPCKVKVGVCNPDLAGCHNLGCCEFASAWPAGSTDAQPACPFSGEDPDGNGVRDSAETWTGVCTHDGTCSGCTDAGQCADANACTVDTCSLAGACERDYATLAGTGCQVSATDDGVCVAQGPTAISCLLKPGQPCTSPEQCSTGACAQGYCCDNDCAGNCERCDAPGLEGACSPFLSMCDAPAACETPAGAACEDGDCQYQATTCQQVAPINPCRTGAGACNSGLAGCHDQGCCEYPPAWPSGSADPQPTCPFAGEDPDGDGVKDGGESWSGVCTHGGTCSGCTDAAHCNDANACTVDSCSAQGTCEYDHTTRDGLPCTVTTAGDGVCVAQGPQSIVCLLKPGQVCTAFDQCSTGKCVHGYCCNSTCTGNCQRCDATGAEGTCSLVASLCNGTCGACGVSGNCEAHPSSCAGTCSQCTTVSATRFDCAANLAACAGNCPRCAGSGVTFDCAVDDTRCTGNCDVCVNSSSAYNCAADVGLCTGSNCAQCIGGGNAYSCAAQPAACTGTCDVCSGSGTLFTCAADNALCTGSNCSHCIGGGTAFDCAADAAQCTGNCDVCSGSGLAFTCGADVGLCTGDINSCTGSATAFNCCTAMSPVTNASLKLGLTNGGAFVDLSAANSLTPHLGDRLILTDSAGKKATGWIKAAGTGETFGSELVTNGNFDGDVSGWAQLSGFGPIAWTASGYSGGGMMVTVGGSMASPGQQIIPTTIGETYKVSLYLMRGTTLVTAICYMGTAQMTNTYPYLENSTASWLQKESTWKAAGASLYLDLVAWSTTNGRTAYFDSVSLTKLVTPSATGVTIVSTKNGSTFNWTSIDAGFNANDPAGYSYSICQD